MISGCGGGACADDDDGGVKGAPPMIVAIAMFTFSVKKKRSDW